MKRQWLWLGLGLWACEVEREVGSLPDAGGSADAAADGGACAAACTVGDTRCEGGEMQRCEEQAGCAVWSSPLACPGGACANEKTCPGTCRVCVEDETRCESGQLLRCVAEASCLQWRPAGETCGGCVDACATIGATRCESGTEFRCVESGGCRVWDEPRPCANGCRGDTCATCADACTRAETRCTAGELFTCGESASGCLDWTQTSCPSLLCDDQGIGCEPEPSCQDQCPTEGAVVCQSGFRSTCTAGPDGCKLWASQRCPSGTCASATECAAPCTDACAPGEERCAQGAIERCAAAPSGCLDFVDRTACGSGRCASATTCEASCQDECPVAGAACAAGEAEACGAGGAGCKTTIRATCSLGCDGASCRTCEATREAVLGGVALTGAPYYGDLAIVGGEALVGHATGIDRVSLVDPRSPALVETVALSGGAAGFAAEGGRLYVASFGSVEVRSLPGLGAVGRAENQEQNRDVQVVGNHLYVVSDTHLSVFGLGANPSRIGRAPLRGEGHAVRVAGGHAYVADGTAGITVFDVTDPSAPTFVGATSVLPGMNLVDLALSGSRLFAANDYQIDAFTQRGAGPGVFEYSLASPASPVEVGRALDPLRVRRLALEADTLFALSTHDSYVHSFALASGSLGPIATVGSVNHQAQALGLEAGALVVAGGLTNATATLATFDPAAFPRSLDRALLTRAYRRGAARGAVGYYATDRELDVVSLADPAAPVVLHTIPEESTALAPVEVLLDGDRLYVVRNGRIRIYGLADPLRPALLGSAQRGATVSFAVSGGIAIHGGTVDNVEILDVSNPAQIALVTTHYVEDELLPASAEVVGVGYAPPYAYAVVYSGHFEVLLLSQPASPVRAAAVDLGQVAQALAVSGPKVIVSSSGIGGTSVIDVTVPTGPVIDHYPDPFGSRLVRQGSQWLGFFPPSRVYAAPEGFVRSIDLGRLPSVRMRERWGAAIHEVVPVDRYVHLLTDNGVRIVDHCER